MAKSKEIGGLELRRLDVMNKACMLKLGWKLQAGSRDLWSEMLWGNIIVMTTRKRLTWSRLIQVPGNK